MKTKITITLTILIILLSLGNSSANNSESYIDLLWRRLFYDDHTVIHLIGDNHRDPNHIKYKQKLLKEAENEKIFLLQEGRSFNEKDNFIFGIEDENMHGLTSACNYYMQFALYKIIKNIDSLKDQSPLPERGLLQKVFNTFFHDSLGILLDMHNILAHASNHIEVIYSKNQEIITTFYNLQDLKSSPLDYDKKLTELVKNHSFEKPFFLNMHANISDWINLFKDIINLYNEILIDNEEFSHNTKNQVTDYIKKIQEYVNMDAKALNNMRSRVWADFVDFQKYNTNVFAIDYRNHIFLKHVLNIVENNKSHEKPFYIIVGAMHVPFLYEELKQKSYEIELNDLAQEFYNQYLTKLSNKAEL